MEVNHMTIINSVHFKSENLLQQLEGWKCIVSANRDVLSKDPFLEEFLAFKMDIAQGYLEELQFWEEVGNQNKCQDAIKNTLFFLGQIQVIIDRMLSDQQDEVLNDSQKELNVTIRVSTFHEYVLQENTTICALAV
jgi:hypothetical protein